MTPTLLGLSGSLRKASTNRMLVREAGRLFGDCTFIEGDVRLPLYDGDLEDQGMPPSVQALSDHIAAADAVVISTPEYNKGISGALKNALDWISRTKPNPWPGKPVAIMSSAAGRSGGERAHTMLVSCMAPFKPDLVLGGDVLVAAPKDQFDAEGRLTNDRYEAALSDLMARLRAKLPDLS